MLCRYEKILSKSFWYSEQSQVKYLLKFYNGNYVYKMIDIYIHMCIIYISIDFIYVYAHTHTYIHRQTEIKN